MCSDHFYAYSKKYAKSVTNEVPSLTDPGRPERLVNKVNEDIFGFDFGFIKAISPVQ